MHWWRDMQRASQIAGKPMDCPNDIEGLMHRHGLVDVVHRCVQVPLWSRVDKPGAPGYSDTDEEAKREMALCWFFKLAMATAHEEERTNLSFEGLTMSLFTRQLHWDPRAVRDLCGRLRHIVNDSSLPIYFNL